MDFKLLAQIVGAALGLLYLYLEYKASIWLWVVGILMPIVHGILFFRSGLYADFGMEVYYVLAGLWGLGAWIVSGRKKEDNGGGIRRTPLRRWPYLAAAYAVLHLGLYFFLRCLTDSTVPFWDSLTTALSMVALWMLSKKYVEQWLVWCVVDTFTVGLYVAKGIPLTALLYLVYAVLAVVGYRKWRHYDRS